MLHKNGSRLLNSNRNYYKYITSDNISSPLRHKQSCNDQEIVDLRYQGLTREEFPYILKLLYGERGRQPMRWFPFTLLITTTFGSGIWAQELTVEEAVASAIGNNPAVHAAHERAQAAAARAKQAKGHRYPKLDLSETFIYTDTPAEVFALKLNQERFDFQDFVTTDPNRPDPLTTWVTSLDLTLPIYTGGQLGTRVQQAGSMATAEELKSEHEREQVAFDTVTAFINLAKAREHVGLMTKARETTDQHVKLAEAYAGQGIILDSEVLKAKVHLAEMEELLAQAKNGARLAEAALNFQMGARQALPRTLAPLPPPAAVVVDLEEWSDASLEQRRDLAAARKELEAGRLEEKTARSGFLPEVGAMARYGLYDDTIFGSNGGSGSIMAYAKINLYRGGSDSASKAAAQHDTASFEHDIRRFEEGILLQVEQAWQDLHTARARHTTATNALDAAREALRVSEHRFKQGLDKMIDLLDAETALREAELRELVARYGVSLNTYQLFFASGKSLIQPTEES
jgi:outer membrane protein TolC